MGLVWVLVMSLGAESPRSAWAEPKTPSKPKAVSESFAGLDGVFDGYPRLNDRSPPVVCMLNCEPTDYLRDLKKKPAGLRKMMTLKSRIEELSGLSCLPVHYTQITRHALDRPNVKAIVIVAWLPMKDKFHREELLAMIRETKIPTIAFCGGHQKICEAYGAKTNYMRKLRPDEKDPHPAYNPGFYKEWGTLPVQIVKRDPIFDGLPAECLMPQRHVAEVKTLPAELNLLASSPECKIQAVRHRDRPVYGTQFHPEIYDKDNPHGRILLQNFFKLAGTPSATRQ
jgi:GMP synthase-like glutamine amidotransferase